jgi:tetratricopeptide (TPR) repeat protein
MDAKAGKNNISIQRKLILTITMVFLSLISFSQNGQLFDQGKELYKNGKYQQAINSWMKILDNGEQSASLYFNLGNAQYKLNHIGPSIYYYEKALQLSPNDSDIKNNLAFAQNARIDAIEPLPETFFSKWYKNISGIFTFNGWAIVGVVLAFLFVLFFLLYYFSFGERRKRLFFASSILIVLLLVGSLTMAFLSYGDFKNDRPAIIFTDKIEIKTAPTMGSDVAFTLHEGTKVQITAKDGNWYRIALTDGKDGWIPASDLKQL